MLWLIVWIGVWMAIVGWVKYLAVLDAMVSCCLFYTVVFGFGLMYLDLWFELG